MESEKEIDAAWNHLEANKERYGLKRISRPQSTTIRAPPPKAAASPRRTGSGRSRARLPRPRPAFYREVLGLQIAGGGRISVYIKHAATPWYIVVLPMKRRKPLAPVNRFTLKLAGPEAVIAAHRELAGLKGVTAPQDLRQRDRHASFLFSDLDGNWWEVSS